MHRSSWAVLSRAGSKPSRAEPGSPKTEQKHTETIIVLLRDEAHEDLTRQTARNVRLDWVAERSREKKKVTFSPSQNAQGNNMENNGESIKQHVKKSLG